MNPLRPFLSLSFIVPKYEGPLPEFDPGDVVELPEEEISKDNEIQDSLKASEGNKKCPGDSPKRIPRQNVD